jgi:hypothetical protein
VSFPSSSENDSEVSKDMSDNKHKWLKSGTASIVQKGNHNDESVLAENESDMESNHTGKRLKETKHTLDSRR